MKDKKRVPKTKPASQGDDMQFPTPSALELEKMLGIAGEEISKLQKPSDRTVFTGDAAIIKDHMKELYQRAVNGDTHAETLFRSFVQEIHDAAEKVHNESGDTSTKRKTSKLPDPPLLWPETPDKPPKIKQHELQEAENAFFVFQLAKADYEAKRGALALKLLLLCDVQKGCLEAKLGQDGIITLTNCSSQGPGVISKFT